MNLYQKLAEIRQMATAVKKTKAGFGYKYAPESEVLAAVTAGMNKYGVSLIPRILSADVEPYTYTKRKFAKDGTQLPDDIVNEMLVKGSLEFTWLDNENPSDSIAVPWFLVGQQSDASQAFGSGLTYCTRYFLLKYFQSATTDGDVDEYRSKQKAKEEEEDKATAQAIVEAVHLSVTTFLSKYPDERAGLTALIKKHVIIDGKGSADYFSLTKPDAAVALRDAVTAYITNKSKPTTNKKKIVEEKVIVSDQ